MKLRLASAICLIVVLEACSDAAPTVDPENPIVDGQAMTHIEYLDKYCKNMPADPMCIAVNQAMNRASTKGKVPKGW